MPLSARSGCPINLTLETLGDRWSLIVIRDIMFGNKRHFRELLSGSMEGIASNVLADRLGRLTKVGLLSRTNDPTHAQKAIYSLTERSIQLMPLLAEMGGWGVRHLEADTVLSARARVLDEGGHDIQARFMEELREIHLGQPIGNGGTQDGGVTVRQILHDAFLAAQREAGLPNSIP